jgi:outer membrane protein assembly factor BamB
MAMRGKRPLPALAICVLLLPWFVLFGVRPVWAGIAFVQSASNSANGVSTLNVTLGAAPAGGNTLVLYSGVAGAATVSTVSGGGVTWLNGTAVAPNSGCTEIWYGLNSSGSGTTITITYTQTDNLVARVAEFSGILASGALDVKAGCGSTSASPATMPSLTTTNANDLILSVYGTSGGNTYGASTNSFSDFPTVTATNDTVGFSYKIVSSTGTYTSSRTVTSTFDKGFNFRNTQAYVTDGANETYVLNDPYPTTRNGITFGWVDAITGAYDASNTLDRRLAGINYIQHTTVGKKRFQVDLPAPGTYSINLALGTAGIAITSNTVEIRDNTTVLTTISGDTAASNFLDASGANQTAANWPSLNVGKQWTFATPTFIAAIGRTDGVGTYSTLAHLRIVTPTGAAEGAIALKGVNCSAVSDPSYVTANAQNAQVTVYWPSGTNVVILRNTSAFSTQAPANGTTYAVGNTGGSLGTATVAYLGSAGSFPETSPVNGTTYYYKVFVNSSSCYSPGLAVNATPSAGAAAPAWSYATLATSMAPPGLDPWSSVVIAGSNDNKLHGMSGSTGTLAFAPFTTGGPIQGRPAILPAAYSTTGVKIAYVTSQDGFAYAVNTSTGAQVWKSALLGTTLQGGANVWLQAIKSLTFAGGVTSDVVIVGTSNTGNATSNKVYALNGNTGATVWTFSPGNMDIISSTSQVDFTNNTVWVTSRSNSGSQPSVWKLNAQTGALITSWNNANLGDSAPVSSSDNTFVYVGTNAGKLNAIRVSDGTLFTHTPASGAGALKGMPWPLSWTAIGVATPDTVIFTRNSTVHSVNFNGSTFSANWTTTLTGAPTVSAPVDDGANHLYIGASDGKVHQLDVLTGTDQKQVTIAGLDKGFNFRNTQAYVTDGANEASVLGDTYTTTKNGVTFGWESVVNIRDRVATNDRRLAGSNQVVNNGTQIAFRVDLPAPGTYQIHLALGDAGFAQADEYLKIQDNTTVLMTIDKRGTGTPIQQFYDATGALLTNTTWPSSEAGTTLTFASTILRVVIGTPTAGTNSSSLAHLRIVHGGVGTPTVGDPTFNATLNAIHVGATDGHIYTFTTPF